MTEGNTVFLDGQSLTIEQVLDIAGGKLNVNLNADTWDHLGRFRDGLERQLMEHPDVQIYGTNVGCGDLKDVTISSDVFENYQVRFIKAHNCGTGKPLPLEYVRAIMVIRLNSFAKGFSAIHPNTCRLMVDMLNKDLVPWVLEEGSVGASGDLVPLAMIAATMLGLPEAKAYYHGELMSAQDALAAAGLHPVRLGAKEAMGITNGSSFIAGISVFMVKEISALLDNAIAAAALSLEAIRGEKDAFSSLIIDTRPHPGQVHYGKIMRKLIKNSMRTTPEAQKIAFPGQYPDSVKVRVQDRYSFRGVPPIHGALWEAVEKLRAALTIEINSATDNPLFVCENGWYSAKSGANFHGQPIAVVIDYVKTALTSLALICNKRAFAILDKAQSYGLPQDLAADPEGGDTGLMITQYAASARAAESRILAYPASITSISTAANQEDFVSMGSIGAIHLIKTVYNTQIVVAVEFLCALRSLQMTYHLLPEKMRSLGEGTTIIYEKLNEVLPPIHQDQYLRTDMEKMVDLVRSGSVIRSIRAYLISD